MASFSQHVNVAVIASGVAISPLYSANLLNANEALVALSLGLLGGVLPDLDSDNSRPVQIAFNIISIFIPLLVILSIGNGLAIFNLLIIWLVSSIVLQLFFSQVLLKLTVHRGIFHSVPMGVLFALSIHLSFYSLLELSLSFSIIAGFFVLFGFIIHLILDEFVSLNIFGMRVKNSFGTALKIYDHKNKIGSAIIYIAIIFLLFIIPFDSNIFIEIFESFKEVRFFQ